MPRFFRCVFAMVMVGCATAHDDLDAASTLDALPRPCITHGDCDVGALCREGLCAGSARCASDADCTTAGNWCDFRGTCVSHLDDVCRRDADCSGDRLCREGECVARIDTCQFAGDCAAGTACVDAECTAVCTSGLQCVAGDRYNTTRHFCEAFVDCATSSDCVGASHCVAGRCLVPCPSAQRCPTGGRETSYCDAHDDFCHPTWQPFTLCPGDACGSGRLCVGRGCQLPCPGMTDAECAAVDSTLPYCRHDALTGMFLCAAMSADPPSECRTSADCPNDRPICVNATCVP